MLLRVDAGHMRHLRTLWQQPCCSYPQCPDGQRGDRFACDRVVVYHQGAPIAGECGAVVIWRTAKLDELCEKQRIGGACCSCSGGTSVCPT